MSLYRIMLWSRFTVVDDHYSKEKYLNIDGFGTLVRYNKEESLAPENVRKHLRGAERKRVIIDSTSPEEAIKKFYAEWEGAQIGGDKPTSKALWIDPKETIIELPPCENRHRNKDDEFICGEPQNETDHTSGEFGMCTLENYDFPYECPMEKFENNLHVLTSEERELHKLINEIKALTERKEELEKKEHLVKNVMGFKFLPLESVNGSLITKV